MMTSRYYDFVCSTGNGAVWTTSNGSKAERFLGLCTESLSLARCLV